MVASFSSCCCKFLLLQILVVCTLSVRKSHFFHLTMRRSGVAVWRWICDQLVVGSIPNETKLRNNLGDCASVNKQYDLVPIEGR